MSDNIEKIGRFQEAINEEVSAEIDCLLGEAAKETEASLKKTEETVAEKYERIVADRTAQLQSERDGAVSRKSFSVNKETIAYRNKLVDGLFEEIRGEIAEYVKSDKYKAKLEATLAEMNGQLAFYDGVTVFAREEDAEAVAELAKPYGVCVKTDKSISLGGLTAVYPKENRFIDKTLDDAFRASKESFVNNTELQL